MVLLAFRNAGEGVAFRVVQSTPTGRTQLRIDLFLPMPDALFVISGMVCAPTPHLSEDRLKAFAALGKRILHFWRNNFVNFPVNQPVCLQLAKLLGQHLFTSV